MEYQVLAGILLTVEFILAFLLALYLLHKYSNIRKQNPVVTISTLIVWFLSFVIIFLLPVDVSSAFYRTCLDGINSSCSSNDDDYCGNYFCTGEVPAFWTNSSINCTQLCQSATSNCFVPYSFVCMLPLKIMWFIIYWIFFILSWILLPFVQSYVLAGYFSFWKKLLRALIENALFYISLLIIVVILFVYVVLVRKLIALEELPYIVATASNTWGLLILAFLLGYGLVEVPRSLFNASRHTYTLNHCYFRAAKLYIDMAEANENLQDITKRVKVLSQSIHYNDPLRKYLDIIIKRFPDDLQNQFSRGHDDFEDFAPSEDALSKSSLEKLFKKVTKTVRLAYSTKVQWTSLTEQTLDLEDININKDSGERQFKSSVRSKKFDKTFLRVVEWYWKVLIRRWVYRVVAVIIGFLSVCIVWSEVLFGVVNPHLSIFAYLVFVGHQLGKYSAIELLSVVVVAYLSFCAYYTVFKIRIFNLYFLAPKHSTDEYSLLFSAVLLSRLALPICLNYLYMIQVVRLEYHDEDDAVPRTAFADANGNTDLVPWLSSYVYWLYPVLILLICVATLLSLGSRLSSLLGYQKFMGEDDFSADYIDEGKALMKRERRLREKSLRECGRVIVSQLHSERVDEILRERDKGVRRERRPSRNNEDGNQLERLWGKAKGFATSKKVTLQAKYSNKNGEDNVELLESRNPPSSPNGYSSNRYSRTTGKQPKGIFDDI